MKNLLLIATVIILSFSNSFAQNKPQKGALGFGFEYKLGKNVSFPALKLDYYLKDDLSLNFNFKPNVSFSIYDKKNIGEQKNENISSLINNNFSFQIGLGIDKHFLPKSKFDPFMSFSTNYTYTGRSLYGMYRYHNYTNPTDNKLYENEQTSTFNKVEQNGLNAFIGLGANYFLMPNLSIGAILNVGYFVNSQKGTERSSLKETLYVDGKETSKSEHNRTREVNNFSHGLVYNVSLKASYFFNQNNKK